MVNVPCQTKARNRAWGLITGDTSTYQGPANKAKSSLYSWAGAGHGEVLVSPCLLAQGLQVKVLILINTISIGRLIIIYLSLRTTVVYGDKFTMKAN